MRPRSGGVIIPRYCKCGDYKPKSTRGVIDTSCRNCGGEKKPVVFGPPRGGRIGGRKR